MTIVVGVDGSTASRHALAWAAEEARLRDAALEVVHVHKARGAPADASAPPLFAAASLSTEDTADTTRIREARHLAGAQDHLAHEVIAGMLADVDVSGIVVHEVVLAARRPATALCDYARDHAADLLVVGAQGQASVGLLLGSVSQACAAH